MKLRRIPLLLAALLLLSGCLGPRQPNLADGPLVEMWRLASPLPAPAGRQWTFTDVPHGYLGEGRRLVSFDLVRGVMRWETDLPPAYAITPGSVTVGASVLVLRGAAGAFLAVSPYDGHTLWEQAGTRAVVDGEDPVARAFLAGCGKSGCDITARDQVSGKVSWRRHFAERVDALTDAGPSTGGFYLLGSRTISLVDGGDGRTRWSLQRPAGAHLTLLAGIGRAVVFTPPAVPGCVATLRGIDDGRIFWTHAARWQDDGAPGAPCSYDPARLMLDTGHLLIPVEGAVLRIDGYSGTVQSIPLDPGEYLVSGGYDRLTWTPGIGYRGRGVGAPPKPPGVPPPADGKPWGEGYGIVWLLATGHDVVLYRWRGDIEWSHPEPTPVLIAANRLIYLDGTTLVAVGSPEP